MTATSNPRHEPPPFTHHNGDRQPPHQATTPSCRHRSASTPLANPPQDTTCRRSPTITATGLRPTPVFRPRPHDRPKPKRSHPAQTPPAASVTDMVSASPNRDRARNTGHRHKYSRASCRSPLFPPQPNPGRHAPTSDNHQPSTHEKEEQVTAHRRAPRNRSPHMAPAFSFVNATGGSGLDPNDSAGQTIRVGVLHAQTRPVGLAQTKRVQARQGEKTRWLRR